MDLVEAEQIEQEFSLPGGFVSSHLDDFDTLGITASEVRDRCKMVQAELKRFKHRQMIRQLGPSMALAYSLDPSWFKRST